MKVIKDKNCDICSVRIGLYQPWYTIHVRGKLGLPVKLRENNPLTLCPDCFHAYENFLIERETMENHKRNWIDIRK